MRNIVHFLITFSLLLANFTLSLASPTPAAPTKPVYLPVMENQGAERLWPVTTGRILPFNDQPDVSGMSEAQWQFLATHYAGTQKVTASSASHLRQYNP